MSVTVPPAGGDLDLLGVFRHGECVYRKRVIGYGFGRAYDLPLYVRVAWVLGV